MDWFLYDIGLRHERVKVKTQLSNNIDKLSNNSSNNIEITIHYLISYSNYSNDRIALLSKLRSTDGESLKQSDSPLFW